MNCTLPVFNPEATGALYLDYVYSGVRLRTHDYDPATKSFSASLHPGRVDLEYVGGELGILVDGEYAAFVTDAGKFDCNRFITAQSENGIPRVEFMKKIEGQAPIRLAALFQDGALIVPRVADGDLPDGLDQFIFFDVVSISEHGLTMEAVTAINLPSDVDSYVSEPPLLYTT